MYTLKVVSYLHTCLHLHNGNYRQMVSFGTAVRKGPNSPAKRQCGTLYVEENPAPTIANIGNVNDRLGYKYILLDEEALLDRFGRAIVFPGYSGLLDPEGGLLRADACCHKIFEAFTALGGDFLDMTPVVSIQQESPIRVATDNGHMYYCHKLILAAGPWAKELLGKVNLDLPMHTESVSVCYWKADNVSDFAPSRFPCLIDISSGNYALPSFEYRGLVKLINPSTNELCEAPEKRDAGLPSRSEITDAYAPYLSKHFPSLQRSPAIVERCMYTKTPDHMWIVDYHPQCRDIVVLAGFSGHGFKAGPLVGKIASELVCSVNSYNRYDLAEFSISRFKEAKCKDLNK